MEFIFCSDKNNPDAINFCNENGFTPRSLEKWKNSWIKAILAIRNNQITTCFPYKEKK